MDFTYEWTLNGHTNQIMTSTNATLTQEMTQNWLHEKDEGRVGQSTSGT